MTRMEQLTITEKMLNVVRKIEKGSRFLQPIQLSVWGFPGGSEGKESAYNAGDLGLILGLGRSPGEDPREPLEEGMATHSSILAWRIPMDRGA